MSKMNFSKSKFSRFLSSKGFYVALAVCLVGASAATWAAVNRTITGIEDSNNQLLRNESFFEDFPQLEEAEANVPDLPREYSPPASSSSTSSQSSEAPGEPEEPSDTQTSSTPSPAPVYSMPVTGTIVNPFSNGELVKNVTLGDWRTHDGIDIAATKGEDILAAGDGTVSSIVSDPLWGTVVTITHPDGLESVYSGLDSNLPVQEGDAVMVRQAIGKLDSIPCEIEDAPHLHFAMRRDGTWIDPLSLLAGGSDSDAD